MRVSVSGEKDVKALITHVFSTHVPHRRTPVPHTDASRVIDNHVPRRPHRGRDASTGRGYYTRSPAPQSTRRRTRRAAHAHPGELLHFLRRPASDPRRTADAQPLPVLAALRQPLTSPCAPHGMPRAGTPQRQPRVTGDRPLGGSLPPPQLYPPNGPPAPPMPPPTCRLHAAAQASITASA